MSYLKKALLMDDIANIKDLVTTCILALMQPSSDQCTKAVARVLNFQVLNQLEILQDNISEIKENRGDL